MENKEPIASDRRDFLRKTLSTVGGALAAGALVNSLIACEEKPPDTDMVKVLTPDGKLMTVPRSQLAEHTDHPTNAEARIGIPGKKFVMVIDLAKCNGCGKCTEACN